MKTKINALMMLAVSSALLIGCVGSNNGKTDKGDVIGEDETPYKGLVGRPVKRTYSGLTGSAIASLNYLSTSAAANATHFANFVEGLVSHNSFGVLELNLAESAEHNADYTKFTFTLRDDPNMVWTTYEGKAYSYNGETQYVKASDFVEGAKAVCNFSTKSDTFYLMRDFIKGAYEYYLYTQILDGQANAINQFLQMDTPQKQANYINEQIALQENVYVDGGYEENPVTADDIEFIANGSRLGVRADDESRKVEYNLMQSAMYFPTLLTYSTYLPVNGNFKKEKGSKFGTSSKDSILYNGPFVLSESDETTISYKKNELYDKRKDVNEKGHGYQKARIDSLTYKVIKGDIDADYTRVQFESGNVDGFSLSKADKEGWEKYIVGDGSGTYEEPYSGLVNARLLDTIGNCYGTNIVMERAKNSDARTSYSNAGSRASVENTSRAVRLLDVRKALMIAFDYPTYFSRYADGDAEDILARQECVHTYVPKNFVYDDNGNEYTEYYYAAELAKVRGISLDEAKAYIEPGQFMTRQAEQSAINAAVEKAMDSVALFNSTAAEKDKITLPIQIEFLSEWYDDTSKMFDTKFINSMNKRLNNNEENEANWKFKFVPTDKVDSSNRDTVVGSSAGNAAFDMSGVMWGWGADYGDPLTYLNTYTKGGDWSSIFTYLNLDKVPNLVNENGTLKEYDLLDEYTKLVKQAQSINDNLTQRYAKFAEAEVMLIEKLAIYMPQVNNGQGWSFSISKSAGYEMPQSNYGLSNDRLTGMFMLLEPLTREERKAVRAEQEAAKEEYTSTHPTYNIYG